MNGQDEKILLPAIDRIFSIESERAFNDLALELFHYQLAKNTIYADYCKHLNVNTRLVKHYTAIPFLPISFFKTHTLSTTKETPAIVFSSSGTTGMKRSKHAVYDLSIYERSFLEGFAYRYGEVNDYLVLALLPSYLERDGSSLVYMCDRFITLSNHADSGFFLDDYERLLSIIEQNKGKKILLIGVAYALLDLMERHQPDLAGCLVMETGGMKGKRREMTKAELHETLKVGLNLTQIHSEYGMTELLSQAYSNGLEFKCPPWMKILIREYNDPFTLTTTKTGGINVIDLANVHSCPFIATQDLGRQFDDHFEIAGRFDNADLRGCNLLVQ